MKKILGLLCFAGLVATQAHANVKCEVQMITSYDEVLYRFSSTNVSLDKACPEAKNKCHSARDRAMELATDLRVYDAQCKYVTDWTPPNPFPIVITPKPRLTEKFIDVCSSYVGIFDSMTKKDYCEMWEFHSTYNQDDIKVTSIKVLENNGKCVKGKTWDFDASSLFDGDIWVSGNCKATFEITYTYTEIR